MTHLDDAIRRALSPEDLRAYEALGRVQSPFEAAFDAFRAQHRIFAIGAWVMGFILFLVSAYAAWRMVQAPDVRSMILWFAAAAAAFVSLGFLKLWFWLEMQKNGVIREVKRLEMLAVFVSGPAGSARY